MSERTDRLGSRQWLEVDIDEETLKTHLCRTKPLISDFIRQRKCPLQVKVLHGSVADSAEELRNTDAVIALELIEHVYDDVLTKIPTNIFGFMQPKIVVFSTPNSDFNIIFTRFNPLLPNGFRHLDHKFEWTRAEFKAWCLGITEKYPNYIFALLGVGEPPTGFESVGHVSQIALFVRKDMLGMALAEPLKKEPPLDGGTIPYKNLHTVDYPFSVDTRSQEEKIWAEVEYELHRCTNDEDNFDNEKLVYKISFDDLLRRLEHLGATKEMLDKLLEQHKKPVENGYVVIEEQADDSSSSNSFTEDHPEEDYAESEDWDA
ncbi:hypothetical protein ACLKA6_012910 [Drosophila palustris]